MDGNMLRVIFLCTGNSCRSQMAEGFATALGEGMVEAHSAGLIPAGVNSHAIRVMQETGIDISDRESKSIDGALLRNMDVVITLCGNAEASCPVTPPEIKRLHWPINDPVGAVGSEEDILKEFRRARDEIRKKIVGFIDEIKKEKGSGAG